jgi:type II secretory pathway pseudopilin PulG
MRIPVALKRRFGFSLLETMIALFVLLTITGIIMTGMTQMMNTQGLEANRTEMHSSVRSATELLQQEIGQAGKLSLGTSGAIVTLGAAVTAGSSGVALSHLTSTVSGDTLTVYPGELLTVDEGSGPPLTLTTQEVVTVTGTASAPTASFVYAHAATAPVTALGAFSTGIVPPVDAAASYTNWNGSNGSTGTVLKLYGDINGDGNMVYVEYTCSQGTSTAPGYLYRNQMSITASTKSAVANSMILLGNILANPPVSSPVPCFQYQVQQLGSGDCVTDVAVTLTVQTQIPDPQTGILQQETKALLNVSPRNVYEVWDTARLVDSTRAQVMPASVASLLP